MKKLRIMLADDHEILRRGLRAILTEQADWEICGEASNGRQAVEMADRLRPDVIVMDLSMPELNGVEATRKIRRKVPQAQVLALTFDESESLLREMVSAGAAGYVLKKDVGRSLIQAVRHLAEHKPFFTEKVAEILARNRVGIPSDAPSHEEAVELTVREREIIQLVAEGLSTKEVAVALRISGKTVENHRTNIMRKLNIRSVAGLVRYAIRNKIITP